MFQRLYVGGLPSNHIELLDTGVISTKRRITLKTPITFSRERTCHRQGGRGGLWVDSYKPLSQPHQRNVARPSNKDVRPLPKDAAFAHIVPTRSQQKRSHWAGRPASRNGCTEIHDEPITLHSRRVVAQPQLGRCQAPSIVVHPAEPKVPSRARTASRPPVTRSAFGFKAPARGLRKCAGAPRSKSRPYPIKSPPPQVARAAATSAAPAASVAAEEATTCSPSPVKSLPPEQLTIALDWTWVKEGPFIHSDIIQALLEFQRIVRRKLLILSKARVRCCGGEGPASHNFVKAELLRRLQRRHVKRGLWPGRTAGSAYCIRLAFATDETDAFYARRGQGADQAA